MVGLALGLVATGCRRAAPDGPPVLHWYTFREPSGAFDAAIARCNELAGGRYRIEPAWLPADADQQREQLVRRLAAGDPDVDIMALDVIWTPELSSAGWLEPWPEPLATRVSAGVLDAALASARWQDRLLAAPFTSNTQLLWVRTDLIERSPDTWDDALALAQALAARGLPHAFEVQGARYEGLVVWFVSLLASAGGAVLDDSGTAVALAPGPTRRALDVMRRLARSPAASPALPTAMEDSTRLAYQSGRAALMVNYTFVWPSLLANAPGLARSTGWARWPAVEPDRPSRVAIGGVNLGVARSSRHAGLALEAAACLRSAPAQRLAAVRGGLLPTLEELYDDDAVRAAFPFADLLRATLRDATLRPRTPAYNDVSLAIQRTLHPPADIDPERDAARLRRRVADALASRGLL